ncbi:hypothetical protein GO491_05675 [Flavobacteriaceae bacterium Ap0902]|nr:hypothetical protein [Flavobacteriaceae bacterium Ap0902]
MIKSIFSLFTLLGITFCIAQEDYLIVNNDSISTTAFQSIYHKNIEAEGLPLAIANYIDFKVISQAARAEQIDTSSYFQRNLEQFKAIESKQYLESKELKEEIAQEIYEKLKIEKKAEIFSKFYQNPFDPEEVSNAKREIGKLRNQICVNVDTLALAKFREENKSRPFWVRPISIPHEIEDEIYDTKIGACSNIQTDEFATYFVKVYEEKEAEGLPPYNQLQEEIKGSLNQSPYYNLLQEDLIKKLNKKINIEEDKSALNVVINKAKKDLFKTEGFDFSGNQIIWETEHSQFTQQDFATALNHIKKRGKYGKNTNFKSFINYVLPYLKDEFLIDTYKNNLAEYEPAYKTSIELMRESLLVNYYIEQYIYAKGEKDSTAQRQYLQANQSKYTWPVRYDIDIYRFYDPSIEKQLEKLIRQGKPENLILNSFNQNSEKPVVVMSHGIFHKNSNDLPASFNPKKKIQKGKYQTQNAFYIVNDVLPPRVMTVEEAGHSFKEAFNSYFYQKELNVLKDQAEVITPKAFK